MSSKKDDNAVQPLYGVSHLDGVTPVPIQFDPTSRAMKVDTMTSIAFSPSVNASRTDNDLPLAKGTLSSDNATCLPWVVHATTGAVLIST